MPDFLSRFWEFWLKPRDIYPTLTYRIALFFAVFNLFVLFLYVLGNFQDFLNDTLTFLLNLSAWLAFTSLFLALVSWALGVYRGVSGQKGPKLQQIFKSVALILYSLIILIGVKFLLNLF